ncbi:MAG: hypothetical protein V2A65_07890 [Candidatus Omnitrophota bacterium]
MSKDKTDARRDNETSILKGWESVSREYRITGLNEQEEAKFERTKLAEEQAKKTPFVLGEPIRTF